MNRPGTPPAPPKEVSPSMRSQSAVRPVPWWLWLGLVVVLVAAFLRAQRSLDDVRFWSYVTACAHAEDWDGIYDKANHPFAFKPYGNLSMILLLYPLGFLSPSAMRVTLTVMILAMWFVLYRCMMAGIDDKRQGFRAWVPLAAGAPILAMLLAGRFLLNDLNLKQLNMITFVCGFLGLSLMLAYRRFGTKVFGCLLLAFSIGLKLTTLPFLAMLLIKRAWWQATSVAVLTFGFLWLLPHGAMGPETHARLSQIVERNSFDMWLQIDDTTQTWSFTNFLHYRTYVAPLWPGLAATPPPVFQVVCLLATILIGLPTLHVMLRCSWREMTPMRLWEEVAMVGVAWTLIEPDGRTAHFLTLVPAFALVLYRRLDAWHTQRTRPSVTETIAYLFIGFTTLWLFRLPEPTAHHFYMHYGLFAAGLFTLYGLTYLEIRRADQRVGQRSLASVMDPRRPLGLAPVYRQFQRAVCGNAAERLAQEMLDAKRGERVLDIGCGPGTTLEFLPDVDYVGFDLSQRYIDAARKRFGDRGTFHCRRVDAAHAAALGKFDLVFAQGVVHHLDDDEAQRLYDLARQSLRPGGRLITIDPCFAPGQSRWSRWLVSCDRGEHVRRFEDYDQLARRAFGRVEVTLRHDLLRIPYSHAILHCYPTADAPEHARTDGPPSEVLLS